MNTERLSIFIRENLRLLLGAAVVMFTIVLLITLLVSGKSTKVFVNDQTFKVEVAKSDKEKQVGLSKKDRLADNEGMLFVFDDADHYSFWMKEMKFPIDIIFINGNRVVAVFENAKPPSETNGNLIVYQPDEKADKVLEVKAGTVSKKSIKKETLLKIENL